MSSKKLSWWQKSTGSHLFEQQFTPFHGRARKAAWNWELMEERKASWPTCFEMLAWWDTMLGKWDCIMGQLKGNEMPLQPPEQHHHSKLNGSCCSRNTTCQSLAQREHTQQTVNDIGQHRSTSLSLSTPATHLNWCLTGSPNCPLRNL